MQAVNDISECYVNFKVFHIQKTSQSINMQLISGLSI